MSQKAVTKQPEQQVSTAARQGQLEEREESAKASASAGLNLNVFGALSGVFSGKSKQETQPDGSSVEHRQERAHVKGAGAGNLNANAAAAAEQKGRETRQAIQESKAST